MALSGDADRAPLGLSVPQAFLHAGAQAAGAAVLALLERGRSGLGQHVDVSAQLAAMQATQSAVLNSLARAPLAGRSGGGMGSGDIVLRFVYPALDGHVSITHVFGAAVGPATRRLMELGARGGLLRRGHPGQGLGQLRHAAERRFGAPERARAGPGLRGRPHLGQDQGRAVGRGAAPPAAAGTDRHAAGGAALRAAGEPRLLGRAGGAALPRAVGQDVGGAAATPPPAPMPGEHTDRGARRLGTPNRRRIDVEGQSEGGPGAGGDAAAGQRPLEGLKVVDFMWAVAGPHHVPAAGRRRRHRRPGRIGDQARRGPGLHAVLRQRGRRRELGAVQQPQRRQARPDARPEQARGPGGGAGPVRLGRRGLRGVLAAGHAGVGPRLRAAAGRQPRPRHAVDLPLRPDRAALQFAGYGNLAAAHHRLLRRPPAGPTAPRSGPTAPTPTTPRPIWRWPRCWPPSTTGGARARASTSTSPRPRRPSTS